MTILPTAETININNPSEPDVADDPAILVNAQNHQDSYIVGTNKTSSGGLLLFRLDGSLVNFTPSPRLNNVETRQNILFPGQSQSIDVIVATDRLKKTLALFKFDYPSESLLPSTNTLPKTNLDPIYGLCLYQPNDHSLYAVATGKRGGLELWEITLDINDQLTASIIAQSSLDSVAEGCDVDDESGTLFIAEEDKGVWTFNLTNLDFDNRNLVVTISEHVQLAPDLEGLSLLKIEGKSYFIVSVQGKNSFAIFQMQAPYELIGVFVISSHQARGIDGVSHTDGISISTKLKTSTYPSGILVVHDGLDSSPSAIIGGQNFKFVSILDIITRFKL